MEDPGNILEEAGKNGNFNLLIAVVGFLDANKEPEDIGLVDALTDPASTLTVFAPTDTAFANLAVALGYTGGTDVENSDDLEDLTNFFVSLGEPTLRAVVEYHILGEVKTASDIDMAAQNGESLVTLGGGEIGLEEFSIAGSSFVLNDLDLTATDPNVAIPNVPASNGIIHVIDAVLLPADVDGIEDPVSLLATLISTPGFELLVDVVAFLDSEAEEGDLKLIPALAAEDADLTVFAPTNQAFANLATTLGYTGGTDVSNSDDLEELSDFYTQQVPVPTLRAVVEYHLVPGTKDAAAVDALEELSTVQGETIDLSGFDLEAGTTALGDKDLSIVDPNVAIPNVVATNGIIHAIDNVLLPIDVLNDDGPDLNIVETVIDISGAEGFDDNNGDFDILRDAVIAADLADDLSAEDADLTVFGPTDAAFINLAQTLNFDGSGEEDAFGYIVDALNLLNQGNGAIPLLTTVLNYHLSQGTQDFATVAANGEVATLLENPETPEKEATLVLDGLSLVDADPDVADPTLLAPDAVDVFASNGVIHALDGVLLPADLLVSDGSDDVDFIIGTNRRETFNTGKDNDWIDAQGGRDIVISGKGNDVVLAGSGRDYVNAGKGDDIVKGEGGRDKIIAGWGDDFVDGGSGKDWISGGFGNDTLAGGEGNDWLSGGFGKDTFVFEENGGHDTIAFFWKGQDKIDLSAYGFEDFNEIDIDRKGFFRSEIDLGSTEITVNHFFFGLSEDDFIL